VPNVPSERLEKQPFSRDSIARQENTMALKDGWVVVVVAVVVVVLLLPADVLVAAPTAAVVLLQSNSFQSSVAVGVGVGQPLCPNALPLVSAGVGGYTHIGYLILCRSLLQRSCSIIIKLRLLWSKMGKNLDSAEIQACGRLVWSL
jgi:hypothetical protein